MVRVLIVWPRHGDQKTRFRRSVGRSRFMLRACACDMLSNVHTSITGKCMQHVLLKRYETQHNQTFQPIIRQTLSSGWYSLICRLCLCLDSKTFAVCFGGSPKNYVKTSRVCTCYPCSSVVDCCAARVFVVLMYPRNARARTCPRREVNFHCSTIAR